MKISPMTSITTTTASTAESEMPEVDIDGLLDLLSDQERGQKLQPFIKELVFKLSGLQKQEELHKKGIEPHH
ncbi:hypothetical protein EOD39_7650 [Acipenser ruthenus]|uniref:Uncharacterized protein n=1 Tax=Acipenser ruthenus TaxID=7906 RepID=A0A444U6H0_ACIRT|nr:hypothetical protein EOD39_7650 [Acipenser ruthenus]